MRHTMNAALAALVALASAGCVGDPPEVATFPLDLPPPEELLPSEVPGYSLGYATRPPAGAEVGSDGLSRIFDGRANGSNLRLAMGVTRFAEPSLAREQYDFVSAQVRGEQGANATDAGIGDASQQAIVSDGRSHMLVVVKSGVFWLVQHSATSYGEAAEPPAPPDLVALLRPYVERVPDREPTPAPLSATPGP